MAYQSRTRITLYIAALAVVAFLMYWLLKYIIYYIKYILYGYPQDNDHRSGVTMVLVVKAVYRSSFILSIKSNFVINLAQNLTNTALQRK